jgi:hypothetical protein
MVEIAPLTLELPPSRIFINVYQPGITRVYRAYPFMTMVVEIFTSTRAPKEEKMRVCRLVWRA